MKKITRKFFLALTILLGIGIIYNFNLIKYGFGQLKGQMTIIFRSIPIEEVIEEKIYSSEQTNKLKLIGEIKQFAFDSLGLKDNGNYAKIFNQHGKPLLWIVTACLPFNMEPYEWKFPYLGEVSYKGFFNKVKVIQEEKRIYALGYDTNVSTISAWSTLGFLKDPVLSDMLKRSEGKLAELIIHESTHTTIYVKSDVDYNENLATFIGEQGALEFIQMKYGINSDEYISYNNQLEDSKTYGKYMVSAASALDSLYKSFSDESVTEKANLKYTKIAEIIKGIKQLQLNHPKNYKNLLSNRKLPNNTYFMSYKRYRGNQNEFRIEYTDEFNSNLKSFLKNKIEKYRL